MLSSKRCWVLFVDEDMFYDVNATLSELYLNLFMTATGYELQKFQQVSYYVCVCVLILMNVCVFS